MITPQFVTAGRAVFTIENNKDEHYTYRVQSREAVNGGYNYFVSVRTGSGYTYIGMLVNNKLRLTNKSVHSESSRVVRVFNWSMAIVNGLNTLPDGYNIHHEGTCGRCGKALTDPESITSGFGPYCRGKQ